MLQTLFNAIRLIGFLNVLRAVRYTIRRDIIEWRFRVRGASPTLETPGRMSSVERRPGGAQFLFERDHLEVRFLAADLVRITWGAADGVAAYAPARTDWPEVSITTDEGPSGWELQSEALRVAVGTDGGLRFSDAVGRTLREEAPPQRRGKEVIHRCQLRQEEHVYGLGNRAAPLNLRNGAYRMWNRDPGGGHRPGDDPLYLCIPVYLAVHSEGSYLLFYENSFPATFAFGSAAEMRFEGGPLRYYVIPGPPARALERYTELTRRPPLPPRWALGYHQSRWSYGSDAEVREVADGFRSHDLPLSAIHLDIHYMDGYRVFTVDTQRFPDLAGLARDLAMRQIRLVAILDCGVKQDPADTLFQQGHTEGVFCTLPDGHLAIAPVWPGWCAFPDFTLPKTRAWWGRQYARLLEAGIAGFWHDMNEPAAFVTWGDPTLPRPTRLALEGRGGDHREGHNLLGLMMARAGHDALRTQRPEQRPFIFSRSGWAGLPRYAWNWTGDTESTWTTLRQTVATVLGLALSGIPFTGPDVGGYSGSPSAELYIRWLQLSTFLPFFRTHSARTTPRREPWAFGEPYLGIAREFLRLRYQLLPYLYTLAWEASERGHPLVRPLFWPDAEVPDLWDVQDAFLLGDALLVAPVIEEGADNREITLPEGSWYGLFDDRVYQGPGQISVAAPIERIPILVRGGQVLPMGGTDETTGSSSLITLHLYAPPDGDGGGMLYSDAGDGYGPARVNRFRLRREANDLFLSWEHEGAYPFPYEAVTLQLHGMIARRAFVDGVKVPCDGGRIRTRPFSQARFES